MKNEELKKWALIAEIVGGIAVLFSLVILIVEVRNNTQAVRIAAYDSLVADISQWRIDNARDEVVSEIDFIIATDGRDALTPRQTAIRNNLVIGIFQMYERAFIQWESGNLDDASWERFRRMICGPSGSAGFEDSIGEPLNQMTLDRFREYRLNGCNY